MIHSDSMDPEYIHVFINLCEIVENLHCAKIIPADVKPDNLTDRFIGEGRRYLTSVSPEHTQTTYLVLILLRRSFGPLKSEGLHSSMASYTMYFCKLSLSDSFRLMVDSKAGKVRTVARSNS